MKIGVANIARSVGGRGSNLRHGFWKGRGGRGALLSHGLGSVVAAHKELGTVKVLAVCLEAHVGGNCPATCSTS